MKNKKKLFTISLETKQFFQEFSVVLFLLIILSILTIYFYQKYLNCLKIHGENQKVPLLIEILTSWVFLNIYFAITIINILRILNSNTLVKVNDENIPDIFLGSCFTVQAFMINHSLEVGYPQTSLYIIYYLIIIPLIILFYHFIKKLF